MFQLTSAPVDTISTAIVQVFECTRGVHVARMHASVHARLEYERICVAQHAFTRTLTHSLPHSLTNPHTHTDAHAHGLVPSQAPP